MNARAQGLGPLGFSALLLGVLISPLGCSGGGAGPTGTVAVEHPFGRHDFAYTGGSIQPSNVTQSQMDDATRAFYNAWKAHYLVNGCGADRFYVFCSADGYTTSGNKDINSISISEGHGYGMIITALMAGHDPDAKKYFDGLFGFFRDHPATSSNHLMAWNQVRDCTNSVSTGGSGTATDGDLDIAYALLLADRQWGSGGSINYLQEAKNVIAAIQAVEMNPATHVILLGDFVPQGDPRYADGTRSSDFMPDHFRAYQKATQGAEWTNVTNTLYSLVNAIQATYSPATGLMPDFIVDASTSPRPAPPNYLETAGDGQYSGNACRFPWRIGTDYLVSGDPRALAAIQKINTWIRGGASGGVPSNILDGYSLSGTSGPNSGYGGMAFVAPFAVGAMADSSNQAWLNALWTQVVNQPLAGEDYYGNTLKMLSMIVVSRNWWAPY